VHVDRHDVVVAVGVHVREEEARPSRRPLAEGRMHDLLSRNREEPAPVRPEHLDAAVLVEDHHVVVLVRIEVAHLAVRGGAAQVVRPGPSPDQGSVRLPEIHMDVTGEADQVGMAVAVEIARPVVGRLGRHPRVAHLEEGVEAADPEVAERERVGRGDVALRELFQLAHGELGEARGEAHVRHDGLHCAAVGEILRVPLGRARADLRTVSHDAHVLKPPAAVGQPILACVDGGVRAAGHPREVGRPVVHDRAVVVLAEARARGLELVPAPWHHVLRVHRDPGVAVAARLLVIEAHGMADLVDDPPRNSPGFPTPST